MSELKVTIDPKEVGMSAERLALLDSHFKNYVDDGRLPGSVSYTHLTLPTICSV